MWVVIIIVRLVVPFVILKRPLAGTILSMLADAIDYSLLVHSPIGAHNYQYVDKLLDTYYLTFICFIALRWRDLLVHRVAILLYGLRVVGVFLFLLTGAEYLLFFFPNVFEYFALFYLIYMRTTRREQLISKPYELTIILLALWIPKLFEEYALHVSLLVPIDTLQALNGFFAMPGLYQLPFYALLPLTVLLWKIRQTPPPLATQTPEPVLAAKPKDTQLK